MIKDPESNHVSDLLLQVIEAHCSGARAYLLWGFNPACVNLVTQLLYSGISQSSILGIVDDRAELRGHSLHDVSIVDPSSVPELNLDTLVITSNAGKESALREFIAIDQRIPRVILAGLAHMEFSDPVFDRLGLSCLVRSYATGYPDSLIHLFQAVRYVANKGLKGSVAEFGICKGGTIVFLKKALDRFGLSESEVYGFDIFEGFPEKRSALDLYTHPKCEFRDHTTVENYCEHFGIRVIKGDICDTYRELTGKPLILTFFDTDNYSPVHAALPLCAEQTVPGGVIAFDHYVTVPDYIYTIGERMAAQEVLTPDRFFNPHGTGLFIKL